LLATIVERVFLSQGIQPPRKIFAPVEFGIEFELVEGIAHQGSKMVLIGVEDERQNGIVFILR
jgi:hypothetical protein